MLPVIFELVIFELLVIFGLLVFSAIHIVLFAFLSLVVSTIFVVRLVGLFEVAHAVFGYS